MEALVVLPALEGFSKQLGTIGASHSVSCIQYLCCLKEEKRKQKNTLSRIEKIILDLQKKQEMSHTEEDWLQRLQEILKDGQRLLGKAAVEQIPPVQADVNRNIADNGHHPKKKKKVLRSFSKLWFHIMLPYKLKEITERLDDAAKDYAKFPNVISKEKTFKTYRTPYAKTQAIGREEDKKEIKKRPKESSNKTNVSIVAIVAMGGMGKTTLAKVMYENEEDFQLKMWVDVSPDFDEKTLVEKVISRATGEECPKLDNQQLEEFLRERLDGKKYMLVLDDVWETNRQRWMEFQHLLMGGARGSLIIVTTRDTLVGRIASNTGEPHMLKGLPDNHSWSLFELEICKPGLMEEKPQLRSIGAQIVEKCRGNPLAIKTVARLLFDKDSFLEWMEVKNLLWELAKEDTDILPILRISYQHLSSHLQKCFAHCALFPKGYKIDKATLIQLWMAEELIQHSGKRILEDIGEEYFKTLLYRNFFEDEEMDADGNVVSCKMHDLMHDLARAVAGNENFSVVNDDGAEISASVIHASIAKQLTAIPNSIVNASNLRTFLNLSEEDFDKFAFTFESLRVLGLFGLQSSKSSDMLNSIGELKELRYLDLSHSDIVTLPNSVCELQNLQTLKLTACASLTELPRDTQKLISLRHLENGRCDSLKAMPCGIGQLTCIQTLPLFVVGEGGGLSELESLNDLRGELAIRGLQNAAASVESGKAYLKGKGYLQTLRLQWKTYQSSGDEELEALQPNSNLKVLEINGYRGIRFPSWMLNMGSSLPYLVEIVLSDCPSCVRLPLFADLPCLKLLKLSNLYCLEYINSYISDSSSSSSFKGWFPSLKKVELSNLLNLKEWRRVVEVNDSGNTITEAPAEPRILLKCLEELTIKVCPKLISMPLHPDVKELRLDGVSGALIESMTMAPAISPTTATTSYSLPSSFTFSKLKSLHISNCNDLVSLREGWLENLTSIESLEIKFCLKLESLPQGLGHLTALKNLQIRICQELNFSDEDNDMPGLISLHLLQLSTLPKLVALPKVLQHSTALETLEIELCHGLMTLPDWFGNLTSLQKLEISGCSELKSLPEGMRCLTALQQLTIRSCPNLLETCRKETGKDWPKIAHIPKINIDWQSLYSSLASTGLYIFP